MIANDVWMQDGKLWISDPNHPAERKLNILYTDHEFELYYASLDAASNPKNYEYIAYYGKTAIVDWNKVTLRWQELEEGSVGKSVFPDVRLLVSDPTSATQGWDLTDGFETSLDTLYLSVKDNIYGDYAFSVFDEEGYQILPVSQYAMTYDGKVALKQGLNIIGYCIYHRTYNQDDKAVWDWTDFKWIDVTKKIVNKVRNETQKLWYSSVQKAVDEAVSGNVLVVYPGIYKEYVNIVQKNLTIRSANGPEVTILEGEGKGGSGFRAINSSVVIEGFTLRKYDYGFYLWNTGAVSSVLQCTLSGNQVVDNDNMGIFFNGTFDVIVRNNYLDNNHYYGIDFDKYNAKKGNEPVRIENNVIEGSNRGVRTDGEAWASFSGNTIRNNEWGVEILGKSTVQFSGDTVEYNTADGIRIYLAQNSVNISGCTFRNNAYAGISSETNYGTHVVSSSFFLNNGIGMHFQHYTNPGSCQFVISSNTVLDNKMGISTSVAGCTITGNNSWSGGGIYVRSANVVIKKNTISGNKASTGGGISASGNTVIQENTISKNQATEYGGGLYINTSSSPLPTVTANKFSDNFATKKGGAIYGRASGWPATEVVTVAGKPETVPRYVPCFTETTNTYAGNTHGEKFGAWGPGVDKWCEDSGYNVHP